MRRIHRPRHACFLAFLLLAALAPGFAQETVREFSMPGFSPLYDPPPVRFHGNRILSVIFKTSPEVLQRLVPKPLLPNPFNLMFVYVGRLHFDNASVGCDYLEAGICIPVVFAGMPGNYAVGLYLDKAMPIVGGREIWGWPKKEAEITFVEKDGEISAQVERFGNVLLSLNGKLEKKADPASAQPELPWILRKIIPSVKKDAPPDVWQLTAMRNADVVVRELWNCSATVKLGTGPQDRLEEIPVAGIAGAQFSVGDFTMGYGEVLHDYLAAPVGEERLADEAAVRRLNADLDEAWNRRDAAALAALFEADADFQWPAGELLPGRERIREHFAGVVFTQTPPAMRHLTTLRRLRFPAPDTAIGDGTIEVARENAAAGEKPHFYALFTSVGRKRDGRWLIAAVRLFPVISE